MRLQEDRQHFQRSSNKLSPTSRLHTRIWEWTISVVGKEWAVRFHSPRNSTRKERRAERRCRAADWLGNNTVPCGYLICLTPGLLETLVTGIKENEQQCR